jgi:hypothetical protein
MPWAADDFLRIHAVPEFATLRGLLEICRFSIMLLGRPKGAFIP